MADQEPDVDALPPSGTPQAQTRQDKHDQAHAELVGDVDTSQLDPYVAALLDERTRPRDDQHLKEIDAELKAHGYTGKDDGEQAAGGSDDEAGRAARARADAGGDKAEPPKGRAPRGKQTS